ncbi:hypothetical protein H8B02_06465 [Bradyrhizobium sp. Pear77]|uniref:cyanobactin maturation protease PatG family protein n=1 Tax=Bradyrhizobium altum TaxID=1571202 RepID=UPI001E423DC2|nr:hypothetical protein [Bradyrhizobium altum]MCC8953122.1 hypothetical protein [Bradyrhizobium altum]
MGSDLPDAPSTAHNHRVADDTSTIAVHPSAADLRLTAPQGCDCNGTKECTCGGQGSCSCGKRDQPVSLVPQHVYAIGRLGADFLNPTNRAFIQDLADQPPKLANPDDRSALSGYLLDQRRRATQDPGYLQNIARAENIIWTLEIDEEPVYAIRPNGAYARETYELLISFLQEQERGSPESEHSEHLIKAEVVAIPGILTGTTVLYRAGKTVPVITPSLAGMYNWSIKYLVEAAARYIEATNEQLDEEHRVGLPPRDAINNFAAVLSDQYRNLGLSPAERARNFVATNLVEPLKVFAEWMSRGMVLDAIDVRPSDIRPTSTDRWDVVLRFFDPRDQLGVAVTEVPIVVDVNYVVPNIVRVGTTRRRSLRVAVGAL